MLNCPKCNRIIVDTTKEGGYKIRSRMVLINGADATATCPTCKTSVVIPLILDIDKLPSSSMSKPKHIINENK